MGSNIKKNETMKIIGSQTSPFTRITRIVCEELEIPYEFEITAAYGKLDESQDKFIRKYNPLMKVPILIDQDNVIVDSRVIIKYLLQNSSKNVEMRKDFPGSLIEDNITTVILGVIDAGILRFMLKFSNPEINNNAGYMVRCREKIKYGLVWLDKQASIRKNFGVTEIALICGLEWLQKRNVYNWNEFKNLVQVYNKYYERPSFIKTRIPETA